MLPIMVEEAFGGNSKISARRSRITKKWLDVAPRCARPMRREPNPEEINATPARKIRYVPFSPTTMPFVPDTFPLLW